MSGTSSQSGHTGGIGGVSHRGVTDPIHLAQALRSRGLTDRAPRTWRCCTARSARMRSTTSLAARPSPSTASSSFASTRAESTPGRFCIAKPPWLIEEYRAICDEFAGGRWFELGIAEGGSTALFALWACPERFVAVDLEPNRLVAAR